MTQVVSFYELSVHNFTQYAFQGLKQSLINKNLADSPATLHHADESRHPVGDYRNLDRGVRRVGECGLVSPESLNSGLNVKKL